MRDTDQLLPEPPANDRPGDRYVCTFPGQKPPCVGGPGRRRQCPAAGACRVRMSAWYRQRLAGIGCTMTSLLLLTAALAGPWRAAVVAPGELTQPHAQILSGQLRSDRCAACHPAAKEAGFASWFSAGQAAHDRVRMTDQCMDCHHVKFGRDLARSPHNVAADQLRQMTRSVRNRESSWHDALPGTSPDPLECAACHREHHGARHDLRFVSNQQCQTCHADRFASFSKGHPEFDNWPYRSDKNPIRFSHATHARDYYAKRNESFNCATCHSLHPDGTTMQTASFEAACASCHAQPLETAIDSGFALLEFPRLPNSLVDQAGLDRWPTRARGSLAGGLSPLTTLLLRGDNDVAQALDQLPVGEWDRLGIPPGSTARSDVQAVAQGLIRLVDAVETEGQAALAERLQHAGVEYGTALSLIREFPVSLAADAISRAWQQTDLTSRSVLRGPPLLRLASGRETPDAPDGNSLLDPQQPDAGGDLLLSEPPTSALLDPLNAPLNDPLSDPPLSAPGTRGNGDDSRSLPQSPDATRLLPTGGWYRDDALMAIRYRPAAHADTRLTALIELALESPIDPKTREGLLALPAVRACFECHQASDREPASIAWTAAPARGGFTRFSHGPHMSISQISSCTHCHQMAEPTAAVKSVSDGGNANEFAPIKRFQCAVCHTPEAAGDSCTQCHRYHATIPD